MDDALQRAHESSTSSVAIGTPVPPEVLSPGMVVAPQIWTPKVCIGWYSQCQCRGNTTGGSGKGTRKEGVRSHAHEERRYRGSEV